MNFPRLRELTLQRRSRNLCKKSLSAAQIPRQVNEVVIASTKRDKVDAGSEESWTSGMTVPLGITPSELPGCQIIGVEYEIAVSITQVL